MAVKRQVRKDFSKEAMYRKIMPSISAPIDIAEPAANAFHEDDSPFIPEHEVYNAMEYAVRQKLPQIMERLGACDCDQCRSDSVALALNALQPAYMVSDADSIREKARLLRVKNELKITAAVIRAVQSVTESPRHPA